MDIKDFQGISYFRFLVPLLYVAAWAAMILGPEFAPFLYRQYCMTLYIFLAAKAVYQVILNVLLIIKSNEALNRVQKNAKNPNVPYGLLQKQIYHAFAIPSYKQDIELIAQTLRILSEHKRAKSTYLVFLAMQQHQENSDKKAEQLISRFQNKFRYIDYARHAIRLNQHKGKASNVSWCVENMGQKFKNIMINKEDVIVTIIDADSWAPDAYFDQVQTHLQSNYQKRHTFIYQPPQIFTRNNLQVPVIVRAYDDMFSSMHASNQITCSGVSFSFSNYSLSYSLLEKIGFWDTVEQAIAQDYHMCLKAHFKTNGQAKMVPIFIPFNQLNIQTGKGYIADIKAKYWQIQRHARAVAQIGYLILMIFRNKFSFKSLYLMFSVMQMMLMPIIIPWSIASIIFQDQIIHVSAPQGLLSPRNYSILFNITNFFVFVSAMFYQYFKRKSSKIIYNIQSPSVLRYVQSSIFYGFNVLFLMTSTYILGSFGSLKKNRNYVVAQKCYNNNKTQQQLSLKSAQVNVEN